MHGPSLVTALVQTRTRNLSESDPNLSLLFRLDMLEMQQGLRFLRIPPVPFHRDHLRGSIYSHVHCD